MKKQSTGKKVKPLTLAQLERIIKQPLVSVSGRVGKLECKMMQMDGKFTALISINAINIERAVNALEERINKRFDAILSKMDAFIKRTEVNEREITFLGNQHDNLAKYCHEKIAYPEYGRKL